MAEEATDGPTQTHQHTQVDESYKTTISPREFLATTVVLPSPCIFGVIATSSRTPGQQVG